MRLCARNVPFAFSISRSSFLEGHCLTLGEVKILDDESNYHKILISEMLHIKIEDNNMNKKTDTQNLSSIRENLIREIKKEKKNKSFSCCLLFVRSLMDFFSRLLLL